MNPGNHMVAPLGNADVFNARFPFRSGRVPWPKQDFRGFRSTGNGNQGEEGAGEREESTFHKASAMEATRWEFLKFKGVARVWQAGKSAEEDLDPRNVQIRNGLKSWGSRNG